MRGPTLGGTGSQRTDPGLRLHAPRPSRELQASLWNLRYSRSHTAGLLDGVEALAHAERLPVDGERKGNTTRLDLQPALDMMALHDDTARDTLHHAEPPLRPSELHQAPGAVAGKMRGRRQAWLRASRKAPATLTARAKRLRANCCPPCPALTLTSRATPTEDINDRRDHADPTEDPHKTNN
jgi:hypothetical protein